MRIPIDNSTARFEEAKGLTLEQVRTGGLQVRWRDADGRERTGLPSGLYLNVGYDSVADAIREQLPGGRALYQPKVRDPRPNLVEKPADKLIARTVATDEAGKHDELAKSDEAGGHDKHDEPVKSDEAGGHGEGFAKPDELAKSDEASRHDEHDELAKSDKVDEADEVDKADEADDHGEVSR